MSSRNRHILSLSIAVGVLTLPQLSKAQKPIMFSPNPIREQAIVYKMPVTVTDQEPEPSNLGTYYSDTAANSINTPAEQAANNIFLNVSKQPGGANPTPRQPTGDESFLPIAVPKTPVQPDAGTRSPVDAGEAIRVNNLKGEPPGGTAPPPVGAPINGDNGNGAFDIGVTTLGQFLKKSSNTITVESQQRSATSSDPNIRGYKQGQIYAIANGSYWMAARQDLDTMLSKIDPTMIQEVTVLSGPYGLAYGPGFAFINAEIAPTPRYADGWENHARLQGLTRTNGGNVYGRATIDGGDDSQGYRFSYGQNEGDDYLAGNGLSIPASFENRDIWAQYGFDVNPDQHVEFKYTRFAQSDVEYPGQFFNIDKSLTDGFEVRIVDEMDNSPWDRFVIDTWYNRTRFNGDNYDKRRPDFPEITRLEYAVDSVVFNQMPSLPPITRIDATTDGDQLSTGIRGGMTFGQRDETFLHVGTDFRYLEQQISEEIKVSTLVPNDLIKTNMPRAWANNPGAYAEYGTNVIDDWRMQVGGRADFYNTQADASEIRPNSSLTLVNGNSDLDQEDILFSTYVTNELILLPEWTGVVSFGVAERAPTLIERYADGLFLGVAQSGLTRVIGDPNLDKETDLQIDLGLRANYDTWRMRADFYHAWIKDYVTLNGDIVNPPEFQSARLFRYTNTSLATLTGFELTGEYDLSKSVSPFGIMRYVEGQDEDINAPLPSISPLDATLGVRWHDPRPNRKWEVELAARMVDQQDRLGTVRLSGGPGTIEEATPGFTIWHLRGSYSYSNNLNFVAGIDNLFDRNYQEHLNLRLIGPVGFPAEPTRVLSAGISPYFGLDWRF